MLWYTNLVGFKRRMIKEIETLRDSFFKDHAIFGKSFLYFPDQNAVDFITYELDDADFSPQRLGNSDKFGFETRFKRVEF